MITDPIEKENALNDIRHGADQRFEDNIKKKVEEYSANFIIRSMREVRGHTYYELVQLGGGPAFWDNIRTYENSLDIST